MTDVAAGAVPIEVLFRAELSQQHGLFHGGVTAAITGTARGYAAFTQTFLDRTWQARRAE